MKKVLLGLAALSAVSFGAQGDTYLNARFGGDLGAEYTKIEDDDQTIFGNETESFGGEFALEGYKSLTDNFDLGLGIAYQFHADRKFGEVNSNGNVYEVSGGEYRSLPIYLTAKFNFNLDSEIKPYLKANLGYSINLLPAEIRLSSYSETIEPDSDIEDGLYWALGGGLEYNDFTLDLMYAVTKAKLKIGSEKVDNDYGRIVLSAGYRFNL